MEEVHKRALDGARPDLVKSLNFSSISDKLAASDILTSTILAGIEARASNAEKIRHLIENLKQRGTGAFDKFLIILEESECGHAADYVKKYLPERTTPSVPEETVSYAVPDNTWATDCEGSGNPGSHGTNVVLSEYRPPIKASRLTLYYNRRYKMNHPERGVALIINQVNFPKSKRYGSDIDKAALQKSFEALDFKVIIKTDLSAEGMKDCLKEVAGEDHSDRDCFACIILSYGNKGVVKGTDGNTMEITDIIDTFKGNNCKSLCSKPKLFFIQACRGPATDGMQYDDVNESTDDVINLPREADILVHYATPEGYKALRHKDTGSWFIQALSKHLDEYGYTMELLQLLTRVNGDVSICHTPDGKKEMPHIASQLTKELYFNPKA